MKFEKEFDCVQMKWAIQKQIAKESKGMTEAEKWAFYRNKIKNNPILSKFLKDMDASGTQEFRKAA